MPHKDPEQRRAYLQRWRDKHGAKLKKQMKVYGRLWRTGWTEAQYDLAMVVQKGCCAICLQPMKIPTPDHDHATKKTRSLLCWNCNLGLGMFKDNPMILEQAAVYLESHAIR